MIDRQSKVYCRVGGAFPFEDCAPTPDVYLHSAQHLPGVSKRKV